MAHPLYTTEEIVRRGKTLYEQRLHPQVEAGNTGMDTDHLAASDRITGQIISDPEAAVPVPILGGAGQQIEVDVVIFTNSTGGCYGLLRYVEK